MNTLWLVDGRRVLLDPSDRGLAYGDGLFETMAVRAGHVPLIAQHLERLNDGCRRLGIDVPDGEALRAELAQHVPAAGRAVAKLIVTRGAGARGYAPPAGMRITRIMSISSWPSYPPHHYTEGMTVRTCELRLGRNPALAGIKHLNRLEQVLASAEVRASGAEEGILLDSEGLVIGATSNNVFAVRDGELVTPALTRCGVAGVMRRAVLDAAQRLGVAATVRDIAPVELGAADELFLCNALAGIRPIAALDAVRLPVGTVTRRLMAHFTPADVAG